MANEAPPVLATSIRSLAKHMGRSESAVRKWLNRDDWKFGRDPKTTPFDVAKVKAWAEICLKPDPVAALSKRSKAIEDGTFSPELSQSRKVKEAKETEQTRLLRIQAAKELGQLHRTDECVKRHSAMIHKAKTSFLGMADLLCTSLVNKDSDTIRMMIRERVEAILRGLAHDE